MFVIHANLDCEARWAGGSLPAAIATRVSYYAALLSVLAPDTDVEVWAPAAIDASRLVASPLWRPPTMRVGTPPRADLAWASDAKAANDRRLALAIAHELGIVLPGAQVIESVNALVAWTDSIERVGGTRNGDDAGANLRWVAKAPWTTAGRDRCHGDGAPTDEQRTRVTRLLAKFGALVVEPWVDRVFDVGVCANIAGDARIDVASSRGLVTDPHIDVRTPRGLDIDPRIDIAPSRGLVTDPHIDVRAPHGLVTDARGTFLGIDLSPPALTDAERTRLDATVHAVGARLATFGHRGAYAIDAFVYRDARGERRLHALCEINARTTFGHVAHTFGARGATRLGFVAPPEGATLLVTPADDGVVAWISPGSPA